MRFGEYLDLWLETYINPYRAPSTCAGYRRAVEAIPAHLLQMDLQQVTGIHLQMAINAKARRYPRAGQLIYSTLSVAMGRAMRLQLIDRNPMTGVDKPRHTTKETATLTADQLRRYLQAASGSEHYPLLLLMATCGLRRGEALGLTWAAIDGSILHIIQQRQRIPRRGLQTRPLKSKSSRRDIPLPDAVWAELAAWPHRTFAGWIVDTTPERLARAHRNVLAAAQLPPITLHGLRHSMATAMVADGTPIKLLQGILGHSHYQLTADLYAAHLRPEAYQPELDRFSIRIMGKSNFQGTATL